jgi:hypothetical protein
MSNNMAKVYHGVGTTAVLTPQGFYNFSYSCNDVYLHYADEKLFHVDCLVSDQDKITRQEDHLIVNPVKKIIPVEPGFFAKYWVYLVILGVALLISPQQ